MEQGDRPVSAILTAGADGDIKPAKPFIPNKDLLVPYFAPYMAFVAVASIPERYLPHDWSYIIRLLSALALLFWAWSRYVPLTGHKSPIASIGYGILMGLVGTVLWVVLLRPFVEGYSGTQWTDFGFYLRLITAGSVVPVFEELVMRGYVLRLALQWDKARRSGIEAPFEKAFHDGSINQVEAGSWTVPAVLISTLVFTLGHQVREWPAAIVYGLLMAALWIRRKDLLSCIIAHSTTNVALAIYVRMTSQWELW